MASLSLLPSLLIIGAASSPANAASSSNSHEMSFTKSHGRSENRGHAADTRAIPNHNRASAQRSTTPTNTDNVQPSEARLAAADQAASAQARATGQPVVVSAATTETDQVTANPDGTFTLNATAGPARVQRAGVWIPINTNLTSNPDGTLSPTASAENMAFSDGGTSPLVTITSGSEAVSISWPGSLPAPTVIGPAATYPSVLPGVNLVLTAFADHFSETLVVANALAAANPALLALQFRLTATNLNVAVAPRGGLTATDSSGTTAFQSDPPIMWDSSDDPQLGAPPTVTDPGGGNVTPLTATMPTAAGATGVAPTPATATLNLSVPAAALTGTGITYPLYIDPSFSSAGQGLTMAELLENGSPYYNSAGGNLKDGYCGWPGCNGIGVGRGYFQYSVSPIDPTNGVDADIYSVVVTVNEIHNAACAAEPVDLHQAGGITVPPNPNPTTWTSQVLGGVLDEESSEAGGNSDCPQNAGIVTFGSNTNLVGYGQTAADKGWTVMAFALVAPNEGDADQWKQFDDSSTIPTLTITYDFPPGPAKSLSVQGAVSCAGGLWVTTTQPTLQAYTTDNNPGGKTNVGMYFDYSSYGSPVQGWVQDTSPLTYKIPSGQLQAETSYNWRALGASEGGTPYPTSAAWTWGQAFTVSTAQPYIPTVTSYAYPEGYWGSPAGGSLNVSSGTNGAAPVVGFAFSLTSTVPTAQASDCAAGFSGTNEFNKGFVPATNDSGTITFPAGYLPTGPVNIYVEAITAAFIQSPTPTEYSFYVPHNFNQPTGTDWASGKLEAEDFGNSNNNLPNSSVTPLQSGDCAFSSTMPTGTAPFISSGNAYSGNAAEVLVADGPNQSFDFKFVTPNLTADYALGAVPSLGPNEGNLTFSLIDDATVNPSQPQQLTMTGGTYDGSNGGESGSTFDGYLYFGVMAPLYEELGGVHLTANTQYTIRVTLTGTNVPSGDGFNYNGAYGGCNFNNFNDEGYTAVIDSFTLVPINNVSYPTFTAGENNEAIAAQDNASSSENADFNTSAQPSNGTGLPESQLAAAGFGAGQTVTVDNSPGDPYQATFTMPSVSNGTNDNVVADGQTIDLPQPVMANTVNFLAMATCASSSVTGAPTNSLVETPSSAFTINWTGNGKTYSQPLMPPLPDWETGNLAETAGSNNQGTKSQYGPGYIFQGIDQPGQGVYMSAAATLPYLDYGPNATPDTAYQPTLYHISVPTGDSYALVTSVTLPYLGTTFLPGCPTAALHILAITTTPPIQNTVVAASHDHTLAINNGHVYAWGNNTDGQLGNGAFGGTDATPTEINGLNNVVAVAAGGQTSMALTSNGTVYAWGNNNNGQLGQGGTNTTNSDVPLPVEIGPAHGTPLVTAIAVGTGHALAVGVDGSLWAWGDNSTGELGIGTFGGTDATPTEIESGGFSSVAAGNNYSLAITPIGTVYAWGANSSGELGTGNTTNTDSPTLLTSVSGVTAISTQNLTSIALANNGTVWTWGDNNKGQLGNGTTGGTNPTPIQISGLTNITAVAAGANHDLALANNGTVWIWGDNSSGELGNGTPGGTNPTPTQISGLTNISAIAAGNKYSLALQTNNTLWGWGDDTWGQLGDGHTNTQDPTPITTLFTA